MAQRTSKGHDPFDEENMALLEGDAHAHARKLLRLYAARMRNNFDAFAMRWDSIFEKALDLAELGADGDRRARARRCAAGATSDRSLAYSRSVGRVCKQMAASKSICCCTAARFAPLLFVPAAAGPGSFCWQTSILISLESN